MAGDGRRPRYVSEAVRRVERGQCEGGVLVVDGDGVVREAGGGVVLRGQAEGAARAHRAHAGRADLLIIGYHHSSSILLRLCDIVLSRSRFYTSPNFMFPFCPIRFNFDTLSGVGALFCVSRSFTSRSVVRPISMCPPM